MKTNKLYIFALAAHGKGISGGDRIFIEFTRRWSRKLLIQIYVWTEGYKMCQRQKLFSPRIKFFVSSMKPWRNFGFVVNYLARVIEGIRIGLVLKVKNLKETIIYSASEFWMDSLPCFLLKLRYPQIKWVASWFQTAPNPIKGFRESQRNRSYRSSAFLYWLAQLPIKPLIAKFADFVLVNNEEEKKEFPRLSQKERVIVVFGAVPLTEIKAWQKKNKSSWKKYDAVFQGRFHPQKGVIELIDIWKRVVDKKPEARLAMIGDGPLMPQVKSQITKYKLQKNVKLFGYVFDGPRKYRIFSQSKLVLHPAFYDSGGMASAEAMAFRLPAIAFDLKSYQSYYPNGMLKVKKGDLKAFADAIIELLEKKGKREQLAKEALQMIEENWSWDKRAKGILSSVEK